MYRGKVKEKWKREGKTEKRQRSNRRMNKDISGYVKKKLSKKKKTVQFRYKSKRIDKEINRIKKMPIEPHVHQVSRCDFMKWKTLNQVQY